MSSKPIIRPTGHKLHPVKPEKERLVPDPGIVFLEYGVFDGDRILHRGSYMSCSTYKALKDHAASR